VETAVNKVYDDDVFCNRVSEVSHEVITVSAIPGHGPDEEQEISYQDVKVIGKGTFGVVYRAKLCDTSQMVAIKKVFHNEQFKVRMAC